MSDTLLKIFLMADNVPNVNAWFPTSLLTFLGISLWYFFGLQLLWRYFCDIRIFAKTLDSKFHIDYLFDSFEINISKIATEVVSNFNYESFFQSRMQLRNFLKHKQKNWENLQPEKNSRHWRWFTVFKQQLLIEAITFIKIQSRTS